MTDLRNLTLAQARDGMAAGDFTAVELTETFIEATGAVRDLNAYIVETADQARAMAAASDARRAQGQVGAMDGIPVAIKDLFCTKGVPATAGSHILEGFRPPL